MARVRRYVRGGVRHDLRILQHVHNVLVRGLGLHRLRADGGSNAVDAVADSLNLRAPCGHVDLLVLDLL